jgi:DNA polymerase III delta subunit
MAKSSSERAAEVAPARVAQVWAGGKLPRVVLVLGAEGALREEALRGIRSAAFGKGDGGMNWVVLHGPASANEPTPLAPAAILDEVCTLPMFGAPGEPKVVVVRQADFLLAPPPKAEKQDADKGSPARDVLERNLAKIPGGAVLVLEVAQPANLRNTRFYRQLAAANAVVNCEPLEARSWGGGDAPLNVEVQRRALALGLELNPGAIAALLERSGQSLGVLEEELAKLSLAFGGGEGQRVKVTEAQVAEVCARTRLAGPFEFADALAERDLKLALEALGTIFAHGLGDYKRPGRVVTNETDIAMRLMAAVTFKLIQLQDLRAALDAGVREPDAFQAAKLFGFRADATRRTLRKHTAATLRRAMEALLRANLDLRSSLGKQEALEKLTWAACR